MNRQGRGSPRFDVRRANVTACNRCRARKQRCDQRLPACSNCERSGTECVNYDAVSGRLTPRSYIQSLEDRIAFLEKRLQAHGISVEDSPGTEAPAELPNPPPQRDNTSNPISIQDPGSSPRPLLAANLPSSLGSGSELWLVQLLLTRLGCDTVTVAEPSLSEIDNDSRAVENEISPLTVVSQLPSLETAQRLAQAFFEHCDWFLPVLHRPSFMADLESIHQRYRSAQPPEGSEHKYFTYFMVMAISLLLLSKSDASPSSSVAEQFLTSAIHIVHEHPRRILTNDLDHMEALTLLAQYASLHPKPTGAWQIIGIAVRQAVELGLHEEPAPALVMNNLELERRRRLFWAVYSLELNICIPLGRPPSIPDEAIKTEYPTPVDDGNITKDGFLLQEGLSKKLSAVWVMRHRRLEVETQAILFRQPARGYPPLDIPSWRSGMAERIQNLYENRPAINSSARLAPTDIFHGFYLNLIIYLYSATKNSPTLSLADAILLAKTAVQSIEMYRQGFRNGTFRYYWRTTICLFRAGMALLYCFSYGPEIHSYFDPNELKSALSTCSAVLWGMAERYPRGKAYRDVFDQVAKTVSGSEEAILNPASDNQASFPVPVAEPYFNLEDNEWHHADQLQVVRNQQDIFEGLSFLEIPPDGVDALRDFDAYT